MKLGKNSESTEMLSHNQAAMLAKLTSEIHRLNNHRYVRIHNKIWRLVLFQFVRGLAFGLGSVIGATLLVSVLLYWVAQIETVPVIGGWISELIKQIELIQEATSE